MFIIFTLQILIFFSCCWNSLLSSPFTCLTFGMLIQPLLAFLFDLIHCLFGILIYGILLHVQNSQHTSLAAILLAGLSFIIGAMVRVTSVTPSTTVSPYCANPLPTPLELAKTMEAPTLPMLPESTQDTPAPVNMTISVDLSGILPEGLRDPRTRTMVVNLEQIFILTITSATQLETLKVEFVKKAIQVLCWECIQIGNLKRNFKMWLQTAQYNTPGLPYGRFCAVDFDMTWKEVLDIHQIPHDHRYIHLRAHHSESTQE